MTLLEAFLLDDPPEQVIPVVGVHNGYWSYYGDRYQDVTPARQSIIIDYINELREIEEEEIRNLKF